MPLTDERSKACPLVQTSGGVNPRGDSPVNGLPGPVAAPGPRDALGRFTPAPADVARVAALRGELAAARGLPAPWRAQLLTELALTLDAADHYLAAVAGGITTRKGRLRAPYSHYLVLAERIATIARLLKLDEPPVLTQEERNKIAMENLRLAIEAANRPKEPTS